MLLSQKILRIALFLIAAGLLTSSSAPAQTASSVTVIEGGTLIDGTGVAPVADAVIVIRGNRIAAAGRAGAVEIPAGAQRIDAKGRFIIPGLIDAHLHMRDWMNELFLVHGVTSILDADSPSDWIMAQKEGVEKDKIRGPRIFPAGVGFRCSGMACQSDEMAPVKLRHQVQSLAASGANHIYVGQEVPPAALTAIIEEAHRHGLPVSGPNFYSREALAAGMDCLVHTYSMMLAAIPQAERDNIISQGERRAAPAEMDPVDYLGGPEGKALLAQLVRNKTWLIPILSEDMKTLHPRQEEFRWENARLLDMPELDYLPKSELYPQLVSPAEAGISLLAGGLFRLGTPDPKSPEQRKFQQDYRTIQAFLREYVSAGGKVLAGSDPPNFALPGVALYHEMELLEDAGLSRMQTLQAATLWPAQYVKKEAEVGTIQPGRFADLVVLDGNPLEDIQNVKRVRMVWKNGIQEDLQLHRGYSNLIPFPPRTPQNVPRIREITPGVVTQQTGSFRLTVRGSGFVPAPIVYGSNVVGVSILEFDGISVSVESVSKTELTAVVPAALAERVGTFRITVQNSGALGGTSNPAYLIVKFK